MGINKKRAYGLDFDLDTGDIALPSGDAPTLGGKTILNADDKSFAPVDSVASEAIPAGTKIVELNHATVAVEDTIADAANHPGLFIVRNTSASGTVSHKLTLTAGTFDGTNNVATLDAPDEELVVLFDSAGRGTIIENTGGVVLS